MWFWCDGKIIIIKWLYLIYLVLQTLNPISAHLSDWRVWLFSSYNFTKSKCAYSSFKAQFRSSFIFLVFMTYKDNNKNVYGWGKNLNGKGSVSCDLCLVLHYMLPFSKFVCFDSELNSGYGASLFSPLFKIKYTNAHASKLISF